MICPDCGQVMDEIVYPDGYVEWECEICGCGIQDAELNEEYSERYANECHY